MSNSNIINDILANSSPNNRYIRYDTIIGSGSLKKVYEGYDVQLGMKVAWSVIKLNQLKSTEKIIILNEYILKLYDVWIDKPTNSIIIITELATCTLDKYILQIKDININVIRKWSAQILKGLNFLHSNNIVHRDLKLQNIFIHANTGNILISGFGSAKKYSSDLSTMSGIPIFMAPEIYLGYYDSKIDIYSFGLCLLHLMSGTIPFIEYYNKIIFIRLFQTQYPELLNKITNIDVRQLIFRCIDPDPINRPSISEIIEEKFITHVDQMVHEFDMKYITKKLNTVPDLQIGKHIIKHDAQNDKNINANDKIYSKSSRSPKWYY